MYVGETERTLEERAKEHLADVRLKRTSPVGQHFNQDGHTIDSMKIGILERLFTESRPLRLIKERDWITRLGTVLPAGLNKKSNVGFLWREF